MRNTIILLILLVFLGCSPLVCRHTVLSHAGWAAEQGMDYKIAVYTMSPFWSLGLYNGHAQVHTNKGWIADYMGYPILSDGPTYTPSGWIREYDIQEYMDLLKRNCFNWADCRALGIP